MLRNRLASLERAADKVRGRRRCPQCGCVPGQVAHGIPRVKWAWAPGPSAGPFEPDGYCRACGARPSHAVVITSPLTRARSGGNP